MATKMELANDVIKLYERGYVTDLSLIPVKGDVSEEQVRETLRRAGYSDSQIDDRDYRYQVEG